MLYEVITDEQALSEMHQVLASQRNAGQADMLARIVRASERLASDPDGFGLCDDCEEEMPFARLVRTSYSIHYTKLYDIGRTNCSNRQIFSATINE